MKGVQCYELFGGIALKIHSFSFHFFICIMHSAFNLFVFPNSMFTSLSLFFLFFIFFYFLLKGYELSGEIALKNNHYYYCLTHA